MKEYIILTCQRDVVLSYSVSSSQRRILEVPDPEEEGTALSKTAVRHSPNNMAYLFSHYVTNVPVTQWGK
jgi:hypothetical protein